MRVHETGRMITGLVNSITAAVTSTIAFAIHIAITRIAPLVAISCQCLAHLFVARMICINHSQVLRRKKQLRRQYGGTRLTGRNASIENRETARRTAEPADFAHDGYLPGMQ